MKIVVIGGGFGGIATAVRLQSQGHEVILIDKRDKLGGRAYTYEQDGFKFDGGPTIITAPWLIEELFELSGKSIENYVKLVPLDPFYNIRFEDGSVFYYNGDSNYLIEQIRQFNPSDVAGYERFYQASQAVFNKGLPLMTKPFGNITDMLKVAPDMFELQSFKSVAGFVNQYIQDERLRQVFSFHPLLIGGNPFQSTSIYAMIHKLEQAFGIWFAMGGTGALVAGLHQLFIDIGGQVLLSTEVEEITIDQKTGLATGVNTSNHGLIQAQAVVSNADIAITYLNLIPAQYRRKWSDRRIKSLRYSMSLFVLYFGTNRRYEHMAHHEILMGKRYRGWIEDIFTHKHLPEDFSLYLHRPTATDPTLAPIGCDCWYVLAPVPHLAGDIDWQAMAKPYRERIVNYLEQRYLPNLSQHIVTEHYIDPLHFRDTLNSYLGSAFSIEPTLFQSAYFRPHNRSEDIPNLYFVGAGTHPGAGIPGVISSSKIVAKMITTGL